MNILDTILEKKRKEVEERRLTMPVRKLEQAPNFSRGVASLKKSLQDPAGSGIIAEIKRKSPSRGIINSAVSIESIAGGYTSAGASGISVLTDNEFFGGSLEDLSAARNVTGCPLLRKDFMVDEYQLVEAKANGADVILLIAAALFPNKLKQLCHTAQTLGLEVLMEVHNEAELADNIDAGADLIGVNNRDLKTFAIDIGISKRLSKLIPSTVVKVSESGIESTDAIADLKKYGFTGFLIGQTFMQTSDPGMAAKDFIKELRQQQGK